MSLQGRCACLLVPAACVAVPLLWRRAASAAAAHRAPDLAVLRSLAGGAATGSTPLAEQDCLSAGCCWLPPDYTPEFTSPGGPQPQPLPT